MTFVAGVPFDGQSLGSSKPQVRGNFTNYNTVMSVNHVAPNASGQGKHTFAEFVVQTQAPATAASEAAIYTRTLNGQPQLFCQKQSQLINAADVQLTRFDVGVSPMSPGYTFLPGGIILMWGNFAAAGNGTALTYASIGLPNFPTAALQVYLTIVKGSPAPANGLIVVQQGTIATTGFTTLSSITGNVPIQFLAIGN